MWRRRRWAETIRVRAEAARSTKNAVVRRQFYFIAYNVLPSRCYVLGGLSALNLI